MAIDQSKHVELLLISCGAMVLAFDSRASTRDLYVFILPPNDMAAVRNWVRQIALERGWPKDWLNDAAKAYLVGVSAGPTVLTRPGIAVRLPAIEQLLAMKLCVWRDDVDIADAERLLRELSGDYDAIWRMVATYLQPGRELTARYAFDHLWDKLHGGH